MEYGVYNDWGDYFCSWINNGDYGADRIISLLTAL